MPPEKFKRKLTAILSADVKGYSRLMGEDEERTIRTLNTYMEVITGFIQQHRGRVVTTGGDSVLAEFASVVDAVRCAVGIQEELKDRNKDLPEDRRMEFRIGVNLGDVVEEGDNILGDGVNVAARMESLAEAGGICISGTAYDQVKNKLAVGYEYIGEQTVKNIKEPVRVYRVLMEPGVRKAERGLRSKVKGKRALVLGLIAVFVVVAAVAALWQFYLRPSAPRMEVASKEKNGFPSTGFAFYRRATFREHERGPKAGIPLRRDDRGNYHCTFQGTKAGCDRPEFDLHLQGKAGEGQAGKRGIGCPLCAGGEFAEVWRPCSDNRPVD